MRLRILLALAVALLVVGVPARDGRPQPAVATVRLAFVWQRILDWNDLGPGMPARGPAGNQFARTLEHGVVDRPTFEWDRDHLARSTLLLKPVRVVSGAEAAALGGRGQFALVAVRPPGRASAWTEVVLAPESSANDGVLVLEVGGEVAEVAQVLESVLLAPTEGEVERLSVASRGRPGVPVIRVAKRLPIPATDQPDFRGADGVAFLVARSPVDVLSDAAITPSGRADLAWDPTTDWRVGDRLVIRIPIARLRTSAPGIVLGWKDRTVQPSSQSSR